MLSDWFRAARAGQLASMLLAVCGMVLPGLGQTGQDAPSPLVGPQLTRNQPRDLQAPLPSVLDVYAGYGYLNPFSSAINNHQFQPVSNLNASAGLQYYFNRRFGAELAGEYFSGSSPRGAFGQCNPGCSDRDPAYTTLEAGPTMRFQAGRLVPFLHALAGGAQVRGPFLQPLRWGVGLTGGGGADLILPLLHDHLALRGEASYQYMHVNYGMPGANGIGGGVGDVSAVKVSGGLVLRLGSQAPPTPVALACTVSPEVAFPGDLVMVMGEASNLNKRHSTSYQWSATGGKVSAQGSWATIATAGLAPGTYMIMGQVSNGPEAFAQASCTASFRVRPYDPPTVSCAAEPALVKAGDKVSIAATGLSPQNRRLTYSYDSDAGQIFGSGGRVTLLTTGVAPRTITVTCTVTDDLGKSAAAQTSVVVEGVPLPEPLPMSSNLCTLDFVRDTKRPTRVDNEAKACLDDLALSLERDVEATLDLVGHAAAGEADGAERAAQRAVNAKDYLVTEKGIDRSRVAVFTGADGGKTVTSTLVPRGADSVSATPVDENAVKPEMRSPLPLRKPHRKPVKKDSSLVWW